MRTRRIGGWRGVLIAGEKIGVTEKSVQTAETRGSWQEGRGFLTVLPMISCVDWKCTCSL